MAQAMVRFVQASGKGGQTRQRALFTVYFWGDDVSEDVDGRPYELDVYMPVNWNLGQLKASIGDSVQAKAADLGLTVAANDLFIESFEVGPPP